jgi:hypothetical protein
MVQNNFHPARTRQTDTPLPLWEFCCNWLRNAILPGRRFGQHFSKKNREALRERLPEGTT